MRGQVYLRILPVKVSAGNKTVSTLAMMDDGSQTTLCTSSLLKRLKAKTTPCSVDLVTIMGQSNMIQSKQADLTIKSMDGGSSFDVREVRALDTLPISIDAAAHLDCEGDLRHLSDIKCIREQCDANQLKPDHPVEILLVLDTPGIFWVEEERRGPIDLPFAQRTKLGWTIQGPASRRPSARVAVNLCQESIESQLERMWKTDFPDTELHHSGKTPFSQRQRSSQAGRIITRREELLYYCWHAVEDIQRRNPEQQDRCRTAPSLTQAQAGSRSRPAHQIHRSDQRVSRQRIRRKSERRTRHALFVSTTLFELKQPLMP